MVLGIVTISYNQGQFLEEAISSVSIHSPHELEYVIVDPGSNDNSREIISRESKRFSKVIFEKDKGPADGLNKGFAALDKAEICGYVNADDRFTPRSLDYVCDFFSLNLSTDILLGGIHIIDKIGRRKPRGRRPSKVTLSKCAEHVTPILQQGTFFRRKWFEKVRGFNELNRTCWDAELIVDMMLAGAQIAYTNRALGEFRIHQTSLTGAGNPTHHLKFQADKERISQKIYSAGYPPLSKSRRIAAQMLHRINPSRNLGNLILGLSGILDQHFLKPDHKQNAV